MHETARERILAGGLDWEIDTNIWKIRDLMIAFLMLVAVGGFTWSLKIGIRRGALYIE
jgi:hypothetical protein